MILTMTFFLLLGLHLSSNLFMNYGCDMYLF